MDSNKVEVTIDGGNYTIVSNADKKQTEKIAAYVDELICEIRANNPKLNINRIYILTLMNISAELFKLKEDFSLLQLELADPEEKYESLKDTLSNLEEENNQLNKNLEKVKDELVYSLNTINDINAKEEAVRKDLDKSQAELEVKKKEIEDLTSNLEKIQKEVSSLQKSNQEFQKSLGGQINNGN